MKTSNKYTCGAIALGAVALSLFVAGFYWKDFGWLVASGAFSLWAGACVSEASVYATKGE